MIGRYLIPLVLAGGMAGLGYVLLGKARDPLDRGRPLETKIAAWICFASAGMLVAWAIAGYFR